jgi:hypothetical protein
MKAFIKTNECFLWGQKLIPSWPDFPESSGRGKGEPGSV